MAPAVYPVITEPIPGRVYIVNESRLVTFDCTATGIPPPEISWRRDNDTFDGIRNSRVSLSDPSTEEVSTPNGTIYSVSRQLNLSNTMDFDSGDYFCQASNGDGENFNVDVWLQLFVIGKCMRVLLCIPDSCMYVCLFAVAPVITVAPVDETLTQWDTVVFTCEATARPRPSVTWWRVASDGQRSLVIPLPGKILIDSWAVGVERVQRSNLTIINVQPSDADEYVCVAENEGGSDEENATLTVHGKTEPKSPNCMCLFI